MPRIELKQIRDEIRKHKAAWEAIEHPFLNLSQQEVVRRLGVIRDDGRLEQLRKLPRPDVARIVAEFKGLRLSQTARSQGKTTRQEASGKAEFELLDAEIIATIAKFILFCPGVVDWRNRYGRNNVTPVKDQGGCGSCVSFGTIGTLESMVLIEHDVPLDLSEAELLFCGGGSCGGWWPDNAVDYLLTKGVALETCFPYADHDMPCSTCWERDGEAIQTANHPVLWDVADRKTYLCAVGPTMCVFEVFDDFFAYSSGVYSHVTGGLAGLHCVEVIGYNDTLGCWICKNSWGTGWGDGGFFQIAYGQCEIDSAYPFWGISGTKWFS